METQTMKYHMTRSISNGKGIRRNRTERYTWII